MRNKNFYIVLGFILVSLFSCKKKEIPTDNLFKFKEYIYKTTVGTISSQEPIVIGLQKELPNVEDNQELSNSIFKISPKVKGKLIVHNAKTLLFKPEVALRSDTEYTVTFHLGKLYPNIPSRFNTYTFAFKTIAPNFTINTDELQSYSKEWQYLQGNIRSADHIASEHLKTLVTAKQNGKPLNIKWDEILSGSKQYQFTIDSIQRNIEDAEIEISWNGSAINADIKGTKAYTIPGRNNFSVVDINIFENPEQKISVNFSDALKKNQNFDGLITLQNSDNLTYTVDGNILHIYPENRIIGIVQLDVFQGIKNEENFKLKNSYSRRITFEQQKPQIRAVSKGTILPNAKELTYNFQAINLKAVDVRVVKIYQKNVLQFLQENTIDNTNRYSIRKVGRRIAKKTITLTEDELGDNGRWKTYGINLSKLFKTEPGAIYQIELGFKKEYAIYNCENGGDNTADEDDDYYDDYYEEDYYYHNNNYAASQTEDEDEKEEEYWDNLIYNYRNTNYNWEERNNPCTDSYYRPNRYLTTNVLASDLGVIVKKGENKSYHFAVSNIMTTNPEANAKITLYNYQQHPIASTTTDSQGLSIIDANKNANFATVQKGDHITYLTLEDGRSLSLSKFNVSGKKLQKGLKGFIYGERGVWRPGDTIHLSFMLNDKANPLPKNHPVRIELTDARGKLVYKKTTTDHVNKFYKFTIPTASEAPTGNWNAKVTLGGISFYKSLKVETVKPNRLKINIDFNDEVLSVNKPIKGQLQSQWLHGAPAKNLKADIQLKLTSTRTAFKDYPKYNFSDPTRQFGTEEFSLYEGALDENGFAAIEETFNLDKKAPGMLKASFLTRVYENGGDFSIDAFSKNYAPFISFVGLKSPKGRAYGSFYTNEDKTFDVVTVDDKGKPIRRKGLQVKIYKIEWRWWWRSSYEDLSSYDGSTYHATYKTFKLNTDKNGKVSFKLNIPDTDRGRYLIRIYDPKSGHATGRTAYFYKNWWRSSSDGNNESAKMLIFSSDKEKYNVGETATITFPSSEGGRALVSIENGTEVLETKWVKTKKTQTTMTIPITSDMAPNVFVNISLVQKHNTVENNLPIRLYGVIPLLVEDPNTILEPEVEVPETLRPEKTFQVKVSEKNNKAMTYTIAVVDEGLLALTRFKTPNAWPSFYEKQALGVKTWDMYDDVIGAYSGSIDQVFAIGGGDDGAGGKNKKANRFKPVVKYLGPFSLAAGASKSHTIEMPNYIGEVRTMVVAGNNTNEAYGSVAKSSKVKKPLMVLATAPRKLSPGEKFALPVAVFAMENKVKNVNVSVKVGDGISVVGTANKQLNFTKPDEKMVYFDLDVKKAKGIQTIEVIASGNGEKSNYKIEIDVENPNPITTKIHDVTLEANANNSIIFDTFGVSGTNAATVEFSTLPPMDFSRRLDYLIQYPHGCVEQTTSSVFPQLYLADIFDLTHEKITEIERNIKNGIKRLSHFQRPNGGMSYWIGETNPNDWGSSYAGHFMIEAEKKGYQLPLNFMSQWIKYQQKTARAWRPNLGRYRTDLAQAYRLYTLALAGHPDLGAMNRLREYGELSNDAKWRLAAAYALANKKEAAKSVMQRANLDFKPVRNDYYTYGSVDRNRAMAMETLLFLDDPKVKEIAKSIAKDLSSRKWMSTQTTAYCLLAMGKMVLKNGGKNISLHYSINGAAQTKVQTNNVIAQRVLKIKEGNNNISFSNNDANVVFVRVLSSGKLPLGEELESQRNFTAQIKFKDKDGNPIDVSSLQQGTDFMASVTISNSTRDKINDIALTELFPSGWEIVNTRFTDYGDAATSEARHSDIRDDRVYFYFDLDGRRSKTFNVLLNAAYLGKYYLPGVQAEAMYDNDYFVRSKGQWIEVVK